MHPDPEAGRNEVLHDPVSLGRIGPFVEEAQTASNAVDVRVDGQGGAAQREGEHARCRLGSDPGQ